MRLFIPILFAVFIICNSCSKDSNPLSRNGANGKPVGSSSRDLLSSSDYRSLIIEIQYMPGFQPTQTSVNNLKLFLGQLLNKPDGITVVQKQIPSRGKAALSLNDIADIEKQYRTVFTQGSQIGVYFLFTDGNYTAGNVLGIAYQNTSMCLFGKTIHDNSGSLLMPSRDKLETTVLEHEFGHILGLVDVGAPMQADHKDDLNGAHCTVQNCLMYYQVETTDVINNLSNGSVPPLDAQCRADLRANGGK